MRVIIAWDLESPPIALHSALNLLRLSSQDWVGVLHVLPPDPDFVGFEDATLIEKSDLARQVLTADAGVRAFSAALDGSLEARVEPILLRGATAEAIAAASSDHRADVIVLERHDRQGLSRVFHPSTALEIAQLSEIPVLILPDPREPE
jgi:nucleotide-binding universal stress UspA family protein